MSHVESEDLDWSHPAAGNAPLEGWRERDQGTGHS